MHFVVFNTCGSAFFIILTKIRCALIRDENIIEIGEKMCYHEKVNIKCSVNAKDGEI